MTVYIITPVSSVNLSSEWSKLRWWESLNLHLVSDMSEVWETVPWDFAVWLTLVMTPSYSLHFSVWNMIRITTLHCCSLGETGLTFSFVLIYFSTHSVCASFISSALSQLLVSLFTMSTTLYSTLLSSTLPFSSKLLTSLCVCIFFCNGYSSF